MNRTKIAMLIAFVLWAACPAFAAESGAAVQWKKAGDGWQVARPAYANQLDIIQSYPLAKWRTTLPDAEQYVTKSDEELRAMFDERGIGQGTPNLLARDVAYVLARRYGETKDMRYAHKSAVMLLRLAEVFPKWPFYDRSGTRPTPHDAKPPYNGSMWGTNWYYYDLERNVNLAMAWDLLQGSGAIEALGPDAHRKIETDLMRANVFIYTDRYPRIFSNVDADLFCGMMIWGVVLGDPALIHKVVRWMDEFWEVSFYPSGAWHEATSSYQLMICCRFEPTIINNPLKGYSDPPGWKDPVDGTRFDNLDLEKRYRADLDRADAILKNMVLPNGRFVAVHDAHFTDCTSHVGDEPYLPPTVRDFIPSRQHPYIIHDFGHAYLGAGRGADQSQVHLHFSGYHGHGHLDNLGLILFAKGKELFSETQYLPGPGSTRQWQASTAAHNTVLIDERGQVGSGGARRRQMDPKLDAVKPADYQLGNGVRAYYTDANLRIWEPSHEPVQVVEAAAENAYYPVAQTYRRTLARVASEGPDFYVVDLFRVKGGKVHDWMLHGNLEENCRIETPLKMEPAGRMLYGNIEIEQSAKSGGPLEFDFISPGGEKVRTLLTAAADTEAMIGVGPAMRREGKASFLDIRRAGPANVFAAVHEPFTSAARVRRISQLKTNDPSAVALKIELDGRTDYFLSTMATTETLTAADGEIEFALTGRAGYVSLKAGQATKLYLIDGTKLKAAGKSVSADPADGEAVGSMCRSLGDKANAFVIDGKLPKGDALKGRTIFVTDGDGGVHGFEIASVERGVLSGKSRVILADDPFVRISGGVYKMLRFPSWGIKGEVKYRVAGTVVEEY